MNRFFTLFTFFVLSSIASQAQPDRWQQRVKYTMTVDMDVVTNKLAGKQKLEYTNNSPDVLSKLFYHLYFNAFQPGSSMDERSRSFGNVITNNKQDWDVRVKDRISHLTDAEIGYQKIISLKINGVAQPFKYHETILEVNLLKPVLPKTTVVLDMEFEAQVPLQIRRSGRDNPTTGVRYSMSQWYPKLCEYDSEGWHPTPYIGREFYGVWGDFDVTINIDKNYKLGGTGVIANAAEIGWGYDQPGTDLKASAKAKRTWHFIALNVHDFMWAADPEYVHVSRKIRDGMVVHVLYKLNDKEAAKWASLLDMMQNSFPYIEKTFGAYPYPQFSFIQGGDGGMEYPMGTLLSTTGGAMHEMMHSWYQGMLATNESMHPWMDEGFTQWAAARTLAAASNAPGFAQQPSYTAYYNLVTSGLSEPLTTHADHYNSNYVSANSAYYKGAVFIEQLGYITGAAVRDKILLEYYKQWRFKHPNPNDFFRVAEKVSGLQLDWYKEYWCNTTKTIDYSIDSLWEEGGVSKIRLRRIGQLPMPIDLKVTFKDSSSETHIVPLNLMFGSKAAEDSNQKTVIHDEWRWTHATYIVEFKRRLTEVVRVEIDPSKRLADINQRNNVLLLTW